jgi:hypothetical protein
MVQEGDGMPGSNFHIYIHCHKQFPNLSENNQGAGKCNAIVTFV